MGVQDEPADTDSSQSLAGNKARHSPILKIAVLAFSLMLAGGFVGYRATRQPPSTPVTQPDASKPETDEMMFSGSKSGPVIEPRQTEFIGGSKSGFILKPSPGFPLEPTEFPKPEEKPKP